VNSRRAPSRVRDDHAKNQIADFFRKMFSSNHGSCPGDRTPIQFECSAVPINDSFGADNYQGLFPTRPESTQENPEEFVDWRGARPWMLSLEHGELLPHDEVFEQKCATRSKGTQNSCQMEPEDAKHRVEISQSACGFQRCYVIEFEGRWSFGERQGAAFRQQETQ